MKTLRRILLFILIFVAVLLLAGYLLPRKVFLQRSMQMKAPVEIIFTQVNTMKNWSLWSPWLMMDTNIRIIFSGPESGAGSGFSYENDQYYSNKGKMTIKMSAPYDSIVIEMDFLDKGKAMSKFLFSPLDNGTKVTWSLESDLGNDPISRWFGLFTDKMVGDDFEKGLAGLNEFTGAIPEFPSVFVSETTVSSLIALTLNDTASPGTIPFKLGDSYERIANVIRKEKLTVTGPPFAIYHQLNPGSFEMEAGIPVDKIVAIPGEVRCIEIPSRNAIMATHFGPYESTAMVYEAINRYILTHKLKIAGSPWEVYISDPSTEPDTSKWQTDIYIPVQK